MTTIASLEVLVGANINGLLSGLNTASGQIDSFASNTARSLGSTIAGIGSNLRGLGIQATQFTAPLAAGLGIAVVSATNFQETMVNVGSLMGQNQDQMAGLNAQILALGSTSRAGPQATAEAFYEIASGVADANARMPILQASIAASEAGNSDLTSTTAALISVMNSYGLSADKASMASDVLTRTVQLGVGSMDEFAAAFPNVTGVASAAGISLTSVGESMAFLTTKGFSAAQASTQMRQVILSLLTPNAAMSAALKEMGYSSGSAALQSLGLQGTLDLLNTTLGDSPDAMAQVMGSAEALQGALALTGGGAEAFFNQFETGMDGATQAARAVQLQSAAAQFDLFKSSMMGLAITAGSTLLPTLSDLLSKGSEIVTTVKDWVNANPDLATGLIKVAAGAVILGPALIILGTAVSIVGTGISGLVTVVGLLTSPVFLAAGAFVALGLGLAYVYSNDIGGIKTKLQDLGNTLAGIDWTGLSGKVQTGVSNAVSSITLDASVVQARITDQIQTAIDSLPLPNFAGFGNTLSTGVSNAVSSITLPTIDTAPLGQALADNLDGVISVALTIFGAVVGGPVGLGIGVAKLVVSAVNNNFLGIGDMLKSSGILTTVQTAAEGLWSDIQGVFNKVFSGGGGGPGGISAGAGQAAGGGLDALGKFGEDLKKGVDILSGIFSGAGANVASGLQDLAAGISGFVQNLSGTDLSGLYDAVIRPLGALIGGLVSVAVEAGGVAIGGILSGIGEALPPLGTAINGLVSAISALGNGDPGQALTLLGQGLTGLLSAVGGFVSGIADTAISEINKLAGLQLPDVAGTIDTWSTAIQNAGLAIGIIFDNIKNSLQLFFLDAQINILSGINDLRQKIIDATQGTIFGTIDIAPDVGVSLTNLQIQRDELQAQMQQAVDSAGGSEGAEIRTALNIAPTLNMPLATMQTQTQTIVTNVGTGKVYSASLLVNATIYGNQINLQPLQASIALALQNSGNISSSGSTAGATPPSSTTGSSGAGGGGGRAQKLAGTGQTGIKLAKTGVYLLHGGERVLNRAETESYEHMKRGGGGGDNHFHINTVGTSPYEVLTMTRRASKEAGY